MTPITAVSLRACLALAGAALTISLGLGLVACAARRTTHPQVVNELMASPNDEEVRARLLAAGRSAFPPLLEACRDQHDVNRRRFGIWALGFLITEPLTRWQDGHSRPLVSVPADDAVVAALMAATHDADAQIRATAVRFIPLMPLSAIGQVRVDEVVGRGLRDTDPEVLRAACGHVGTHRSNPVGAEALLEPIVRHPDAEVARMGMFALSQLPGVAIEPLLVALRGPLGDVRAGAARAIASAVSRLPGPQREVRAAMALRVALGDPDGRVREAAAIAIGQCGFTQATEDLRQLLADQAPAVRAGAIAGLSTMGSLADAETIAHLADHDPDRTVQEAAIVYAHHLGSPKLTGAILRARSWMDDERWRQAVHQFSPELAAGAVFASDPGSSDAYEDDAVAMVRGNFWSISRGIHADSRGSCLAPLIAVTESAESSAEREYAESVLTEVVANDVPRLRRLRDAATGHQRLLVALAMACLGDAQAKLDLLAAIGTESTELRLAVVRGLAFIAYPVTEENLARPPAQRQFSEHGHLDGEIAAALIPLHGDPSEAIARAALSAFYSPISRFDEKFAAQIRPLVQRFELPDNGEPNPLD